MDNPEAMERYYELLLSVLKIIASVVLSRGAQNDETIEQARTFLMENRPTVVTIFKRQASIGSSRDGISGKDLQELVEFFVLLISVTGFLEVSLSKQRIHFRLANIPQYEEQQDTHRSQRAGFL